MNQVRKIVFIILTFVLESGASLSLDPKMMISIFVGVFGVSPLLYTLTSNTSSDTVYFITAILLFVHLFWYNYNAELQSTQATFENIEHCLPNSLSLNSAFLASILLASRLPSIIHVFALAAFSLIHFGVFPLVRLRSKQLLKNESTGHYILCSTIAIIVFFMLLRINWILSVCYLAILLFIQIGCPIWLDHLQDIKKFLSIIFNKF